ncbi:integrase core domain-containing protein [Actinomadura sp. 6N118]|uniref:integrase core domain-containing protein n=1 Tax=Actinomadura sp. 6N118 TaxID=3375151 RepID=UPI00378FF157
MFKQACTVAGTTQSMGRTGSALDNAVAEAFNSTLELLARHRCDQARRAVAAWIDDYNIVRHHSAAAMMSPIDYERARNRTDDQEQTHAATAAA